MLSRSTSFFRIAAQALLTLICIVVLLRLWQVNLLIPIAYGGDSVFYTVLAKAIATDQWVWFNHNLGAPFGLPFAAFPQNITFTSVVMWIISRFTSEPGLIINLFWIGAQVATSVFCHLALRTLKISFLTSLVLSTLYALLPYAFYRNIAHVSLTYMFVPLLAAYALDVLASSTGEIQRFTPRVTALVVAACLAMGLDYIYHAFFACFFLLLAGSLGAIIEQGWRPLKRVLPLIALIILCALVNLIPTLITWQMDGVPAIPGKSPAEAEIYGLKIRQLLGSTFIDMLGRNITWPLETENKFSRLGLVIGIGYVMAVVYGLLGNFRPGKAMIWSAGILAIGGTLLATIGGFGALFAFFVSPDIRAYSRISVYLGFFAVFVLGFHLDLLRGYRWKPAFYLLLGGSFVVALIDQGFPSRELWARHEVDTKAYTEERDIVAKIESNPEINQVYQLPNVGFPPGGGPLDRIQYDHGRPYLWSSHIRWSWPNPSYKYDAWLRAIGSAGSDQFIPNLVASGFNGLWIDRWGYDDAERATVEFNMVKRLGQPTLVSSNGRYIFYSLIGPRTEWLARTPESDQSSLRLSLMEAIGIKFGRHFYSKESNASNEWYWSQEELSLTLLNSSDRQRHVTFKATIRGAGSVHVQVDGQTQVIQIQIGQGGSPLSVPLDLVPKSRLTILFRFEGSRVDAPGDHRRLYFGLFNPQVN